MAFVPGFQYDLFISYAHGDNESVPPDPGWASYFEHSLRVNLRQFLGAHPEIFLDQRKLGGEIDFSGEIRDSLSGSAAMLAIVSPSYLTSLFCRKEREWFLKEIERSGGLRVGNRFRMVKVVRLPAPDNRHRLFLKEQLGFEFFEQSSDGSVRFYTIDTSHFRDRLLSVAQGIAGLLTAMRNQRQSVYLAESSLELAEKEHPALKAELTAHGYRVLPEFFVEDEEAIRNDLAPASLSVHLIGGEYDGATELQFAAAKEHSQPMLVWLSPAASATSDRRQLSFIKQVREVSGRASKYVLLEKTSLAELKTIVLDQLRPRAEISQKNGARRIYLLYDRSETSDVEQASRIREEIKRRDSFEVWIPEGLLENHREMLSSCDGVLLYWGNATAEWYEEARDELKIAPRLLRTKPFVSEAIYLAEPESATKDDVHRREGRRAIRQQNGFRIADLEPFLAALREAA